MGGTSPPAAPGTIMHYIALAGDVDLFQEVGNIRLLHGARNLVEALSQVLWVASANHPPNPALEGPGVPIVSVREFRSECWCTFYCNFQDAD